MELPFLVESGILLQRDTRGLLLECPYALQLTIVSNFVAHVHDVLSPFLPMLSGPNSSSSAAIASSSAMGAIRGPSYARDAFGAIGADRLPLPILRSEEDLVYVTNTVGIAFSFPCGDGRAYDVIHKAIDIYGVLMSALFHDVALPHLGSSDAPRGDDVLARHFVLMLEHTTRLLASRVGSSGGDGSGQSAATCVMRHAELLGKLVDALGKGLWWMARRLSTEQWSHIIRVLSGCLAYWTSAANDASHQHSPSRSLHLALLPNGPVLYSLASLHWEAVLLSNTRDPKVWEVLGARCPAMVRAEVVSQWGKVMVSLTRAMCRIVMGGGAGSAPEESTDSAPRPITVRWGGVQQHVRNETHCIDLDEPSVAFLWKRMLESLYRQDMAVMSLDTRIVFMGALRDVALLLAHSSYLSHCPLHLCYHLDGRDAALIGPASACVPLGPSTAALCTMLGDGLMRGLASVGGGGGGGAMAHTDEGDVLTMRALQGMAFVLLRRETAVAIREGSGPAHHHLQLFFSTIAVLGEDRSAAIRSELVLYTSPIFFVDVPIPLLAIESIGNAACALVAGLFDQEGALGDDEEEDDEGDGARSALAKVWAVVSAFNSYMHARVLGMPSALPNAVFAALHAGIETQQAVAPVVQRLLCAASSLFYSVDSAVGVAASTHRSPKLSDILQSMLTVIGAPYAAYAVDTVLTALLCVGWIPFDQYPGYVAKHVVAVLSQACVAARSVMEQTDLGIEDTTGVYVHAVRALCTILSGPLGPSLCGDAAIAAQLLRAVEVGTRDVLVPNSGMRDAAASLYHSYLWALSSPVAGGSTGASSPETERDFMATATAVKCFAVGSFGLITLIQNREGVAIIVRSPSGRRVYRATQRAYPLVSASEDALAYARALEAQLHEAVPSESVGDGSGAIGDDPLRCVWGEPSVRAMLDGLRASVKSQDTVAAMSAARFAPRDAYTAQSTAMLAPPHSTSPATDPSLADSATPFAPLASDRIIADLANNNVEAARQVSAAVLQLGKGAVRSIPFDTALVAMLKGVDGLPEKEVIDISLVCIVNQRGDAAPQCFWDFAAALGLPEDNAVVPSPELCPLKEVVFEDGFRRIHFFPSVVAADALDADGGEVDHQGDDADRAMHSAFSTVRLLWDATSEGYNWAGITHAAHDAFKELSPNFVPSAHRQCMDVLLRPLPAVGLTSVRLQLPDPLVPTVEVPMRWGAPLLHGSVLPSTMLCRMVREAVHNATTQRLMETGQYRFPSLVRKAALWSIAAPHPVLLPVQYVSAFDEEGSVSR